MATTTDLKQRGLRKAGATEVKDYLRYDRAPGVPDAPEARIDEAGHDGEQKILAMFCYEDPHGTVGRFVKKTTAILAGRDIAIHIFSRRAFRLDLPDVCDHPIGTCEADTLLGEVREFTRRASNAFLRNFQSCSTTVTLMGHEWSAIPTMSLLHGIKNTAAMLSLHSLERQRSDLSSDVSKWIEETELSGLREARAILTHDAGTADLVKQCLPECADRIIDACPHIPMEHFEFTADKGEVKGRFEIGPVDPTILFIGDLDYRYGPDRLMKAMPGVLRDHPQARCVFVGDGDLVWPLRVYSRYLLLDHAVRLAGHLAENALYDLIHAADVVVVPSIEQTPWWPIEAAWAAKRPVVATQDAAPALLQHERDSLVVNSDEHSLVAGIGRVLGDPELGQTLAHRGRAKLEARYNENKVVAQIIEAMGIEVAV
ncbi:MAG: glycosyltransferase family 4 protein [Thermoguttaceae bacterium]